MSPYVDKTMHDRKHLVAAEVEKLMAAFKSAKKGREIGISSPRCASAYYLH
jgi:hypothetical protein